MCKFVRLDVLVHNAGDFHAGFFEELADARMRAQFETLLFGPMNVTRVTVAAWKGMSGKQGGDPAKLARAHGTLTGLPVSPLRSAPLSSPKPMRSRSSRARLTRCWCRSTRTAGCLHRSPIPAGRAGVRRHPERRYTAGHAIDVPDS